MVPAFRNQIWNITSPIEIGNNGTKGFDVSRNLQLSVFKRKKKTEREVNKMQKKKKKIL